MLKWSMVFLATVSALTAGCATAPSLPPALQVRQCREPAQRPRLNGMKRVAVLELKNCTASPDASEKVVGPFTAGLMETGRFDLVERNRIDKVIQELKLGMSGLVDTKTAKEAGRMLGADAVIVGEVTNYQVEVKPFEYKYSRDKTDLMPLPPGEKTPTIVTVPAETRTYTVDKYYVSVGFTLRMVAVESGEIVWSRHVAKSFGMREGEYEIRNVNLLLDKILDAAVAEAMCDFR
ncbi:CsgG/HfaB family protein [Geomesophilobacter sediminis]|uniref:FlgO domain-containing protein n=1 Tax=Geomesophilobacter sediminis TaxID=2798584 RepID=A0A8J7INC4_9BACT|nr:CsgG/HfaB family protein [Geomesophilobacter sediminis]MBJ6723514.1 hypothetical protein [Geomesophilobacter sediminis]